MGIILKNPGGTAPVKLQLVTGQACNLDFDANWVDYTAPSTFAPDTTTANITTATTTDVVAAPAAGVVRTVNGFTARNKHATNAVDLTVVKNDNGAAREKHKVTLQAGETLEYENGVGFYLMAAVSSLLQLTSWEAQTGQRTAFSQLERAAVGTLLLASGTAYYVYVGRTVRALTVAFVEFHVSTAGAGAQTAEAGLFSTTSPPNKSAQTLTKLAATGTVDSLTATGVRRNTASFALSVAAGTHLWAAVRTAMATTQPTCGALAGDMSQGAILTTTGGLALTALGSAAGTIPALSLNPVAPDLRVTLD